jgi:hypothetical protein
MNFTPISNTNASTASGSLLNNHIALPPKIPSPPQINALFADTPAQAMHGIVFAFAPRSLRDDHYQH